MSHQPYALASYCIPGKQPLLSIEQKAEFTPKTVCTFWRREKSLAPAGIQTLDCPAHSLVIIPDNTINLQVKIIMDVQNLLL